MSEASQEGELRERRMAVAKEFAAGLAHAIRNPLNSATLQLSVVERRLADPAPAARQVMQEALAVIRQELLRLDGIVEDFVAFSQSRPSKEAHGSLAFLNVAGEDPTTEKP